MKLKGKKVHSILIIPKCSLCNNKAERIFLVGDKEYIPRCWIHCQGVILQDGAANAGYLDEPLIEWMESVLTDFSDEED